MIYRHYVANSLRLNPEGKQLTLTLEEVMHPAPVDRRKSEEIVLDVMNKAGLRFGD